ncbi:hypothetical protein NE236_20405 [Actinoallomurus purpureus]|uniref:hypothetical protein n=1 Tax=Actinoallomurus purpureus TaxID=478114 RepID=UPI002093937B|nr:hypothetical protein [Actinoallomurus purpureus]MCO6007346.1 hypothetical protein [Actinoallomurus purpureus]
MVASVVSLERCLNATPWTVRLGRGSMGQPALEVYDAETLIDVVVETSVAPEILRGARCGVSRGRPYAVAWGRLPADSIVPAVLFSTGRWARETHPAEAIGVGGFCWLAVMPGRYRTVTVGQDGTRCARLRVRAGHPS